MSDPSAELSLARDLLDWFAREKRDLPWRRTHDPYRVWVAEAMLVQTQVATVVPYYERFLRLFPDVAALAAAPLDEVLKAWEGLGYYARARHLHRSAREIMARHGGRFPTDPQALRALPGDYRTFLLAVTLFGVADFAPTLMILRASTVLEPALGVLGAARMAALLYTLRNIVYAAASFPIGALSDRFSRTRYLALGYAVAAITFLGFAFVVPSVWWFVLCFSLAGVFIAWEDTIEGVAVRDYVRTEVAGTAYGALGVANGIGDFVSSLVVGALWAWVGPTIAFGYAAAIGLAGAVLMAHVPARRAGSGG